MRMRMRKTTMNNHLHLASADTLSALADLEQGSAAWHLARLGRITASLASACLGMHPYVSPQSAWRQIRGEEVPRGNWFMEQGREFEPVAARKYADQICLPVVETGFHVHHEYDWLGSSPDRLIGSEGLAEIKVGKELPQKPKLYWRIQGQIQLACTRRKWCDLIAFAGGLIRVWRIWPAAHAKLIGWLNDWRKRHLIGNKCPTRGEYRRWPQ